MGLGFHEEPKKGSMRIAYLSICLYGFVILAMYQSMIAARFTISASRPPVNSLEELLDSPYKLFMIEDSKYKMILNAKSSSIYGKIRDSGKVKPLGSVEMFELESKWIKSAVKSKYGVLL